MVILVVAGKYLQDEGVFDAGVDLSGGEPVTYGQEISDFQIPEYDGDLYVEINDNIPFFTEDDLTTESYENYSPLDEYGRCGVAMANIGTDLMPTEPRGEIWQIKPTGWQSAKYDFVDGYSLYNRSHLIAFMLAGENDNERNLITGTRSFNAEGMQPFEIEVCDYVEDTDNHVLYRVTPVFGDDNLVADGVLMEAYSVEDNGKGICFNVFVYNVEPGVEIDYSDGSNRPADR